MPSSSSFRAAGEFDGEILQDTPESITLRLDHGTVSLPRSMVTAITKSGLVKPEPSAGTAIPVGTAAPSTRPALRIPDRRAALGALAKRPWAKGLIPATVVDKGQMRHVPYSS